MKNSTLIVLALTLCSFYVSFGQNGPHVSDQEIAQSILRSMSVNPTIDNPDSVQAGQTWFYLSGDGESGKFKVLKEGEVVWKLTEQFIREDSFLTYNLEATSTLADHYLSFMASVEDLKASTVGATKQLSEKIESLQKQSIVIGYQKLLATLAKFILAFMLLVVFLRYLRNRKSSTYGRLSTITVFLVCCLPALAYAGDVVAEQKVSSMYNTAGIILVLLIASFGIGFFWRKAHQKKEIIPVLPNAEVSTKDEHAKALGIGA